MAGGDGSPSLYQNADFFTHILVVPQKKWWHATSLICNSVHRQEVLHVVAEASQFTTSPVTAEGKNVSSLLATC